MLRRRPLLREDRLVWIFGSPRSGSTWLMRLLARHERVCPVDETYLGQHVAPLDQDNLRQGPGDFFASSNRAGEPGWLFAAQWRAAWEPALRELVLRRLGAQAAAHPARDPLVVVKEPNGSHAADAILGVLPGARLLFLLRDGRDVVDSMLDLLTAPGSWWRTQYGTDAPPGARIALVREQAELWCRRTRSVRAAYDALPDERRLLVRYEDLLADTAGELARVAGRLGLGWDREALGAAAAELAFDRIPDAERGPGRFHRAARPGLWRENLDAEEQAAMLEVLRPVLAAEGYGTG